MEGTSIIEINKLKYFENLQFVRSKIHKGVRISSVVKSNAYGHGIGQIVPLAEEAGIDHFSVFCGREAKLVYKVKRNPDTDIMVMGWLTSPGMKWAIEKGVEFFVFEYSVLKETLKNAKKLKKKAKIHIEIETGLNRTGFDINDLNKVFKLINDNKNNFLVKGIATHYSGSESIANHVRVRRQTKKFNKIYQLFLKNNIQPEYRHIACSAALINYPESQMDMVRIGIIQYGFWPSIETFIGYIQQRTDKTDPLKRILTWKTKVMSVKKVKMGEFISYGSSYLAQENKTIAVIPIGYSQGFGRNLSNFGKVIVGGELVKVIGLVNMNMLIIDVTSLSSVKRGDEVVLIGKQGISEISVSSFSDMSDMLNYESLTRLPKNIKRKVV